MDTPIVLDMFAPTPDLPQRGRGTAIAVDEESDLLANRRHRRWRKKHEISKSKFL